MSDKEIYIAYVLDENARGKQLYKYAFEHPTIEFWGEPDEQAKLIAYFNKHHWSGDTPFIIEKSDFIDVMQYVEPELEKE